MSPRDSLTIVGLVGPPVVLGLLALVLGARILKRKAPGVRRETATLLGGVLVTVTGVVMLMGGLGVGACFGFWGTLKFH